MNKEIHLRICFKRPIRWDGPDDENQVIRDADFVIDRSGGIIKDRFGRVPRQATQEEIESCEVIH